MDSFESGPWKGNNSSPSCCWRSDNFELNSMHKAPFWNPLSSIDLLVFRLHLIALLIRHSKISFSLKDRCTGEDAVQCNEKKEKEKRMKQKMTLPPDQSVRHYYYFGAERIHPVHCVVAAEENGNWIFSRNLLVRLLLCAVLPTWTCNREDRSGIAALRWCLVWLVLRA